MRAIPNTDDVQVKIVLSFAEPLAAETIARLTIRVEEALEQANLDAMVIASALDSEVEISFGVADADDPETWIARVHEALHASTTIRPADDAAGHRAPIERRELVTC